jgi:hypothetical protein
MYDKLIDIFFSSKGIFLLNLVTLALALTTKLFFDFPGVRIFVALWGSVSTKAKKSNSNDLNDL